MAKQEKRKSVRAASVYFQDQLDNLDLIILEKGGSRADLLRQGADSIINTPENQAIIAKHKKA